MLVYKLVLKTCFLCFEVYIQNMMIRKNDKPQETITYGIHDTTIGQVVVAESCKGVCWLGFMCQKKMVPIRAMALPA